MKYYLIALLLLGFIACNKEQADSVKHVEQLAELGGLKALHDKYCQLAVDYIVQWRKNGELDDSKIAEMWQIIGKELSKDLNLTGKEVDNLFDQLGMNSSNWISWYSDGYPKLPKEYQEFIEELESTYKNNLNKSDEELIDLIEKTGNKYKENLDADVVQNAIEVAKSSMIFWRANFNKLVGKDYLVHSRCIGTFCLGPEDCCSGYFCVDNKCNTACVEGIVKFLGSDVWGGTWGGIFAGLPGVVLGGTGSSVGAAIMISIYGLDC